MEQHYARPELPTEKICKHSHEGSFETRVGRERQLSAIANQLHELGFRQLKATSLKQKHVQTLVDLWLKQGLSPGTIKNRMSCLRWWAEKVNKRAVVAAVTISMGYRTGSLCRTKARRKTWKRNNLPWSRTTTSE
jgi:site-specific recombinase XerC